MMQMEPTNRTERRPDHAAPSELLPPCLPSKFYHGERTADGGCAVWCEKVNPDSPGGLVTAEALRRPVPLCLEIRNHSPTGFQWGYAGSGPAQLALALLVDALGAGDEIGSGSILVRASQTKRDEHL